MRSTKNAVTPRRELGENRCAGQVWHPIREGLSALGTCQNLTRGAANQLCPLCHQKEVERRRAARIAKEAE